MSALVAMMSEIPAGEVTKLLSSSHEGDEEAQRRLLEVAYDELRRIAGSFMRSERVGHTLQPTALIHEAGMRLLSGGALENVKDRAHFFRTMGQAMRHVLVDHARRRQSQRRGGQFDRAALDDVVDSIRVKNGIDLLDLDEAIERLSRLNPRHGDVVVLRFFGGFEMKEIAEQLSVSLSTVESDWRLARAWLQRELE